MCYDLMHEKLLASESGNVSKVEKAARGNSRMDSGNTCQMKSTVNQALESGNVSML